MSQADPLVNTCGCCGVTGPAGACGCPAGSVSGARPGLPAIPYRVGTHGSFLAAMTAALDHQPALGSFTTRDAGDPVIGLLDAWATVLDVVTFYQERIANEGYLRTATERRSVVQLAAEIGYLPGAGVATTTYLAFEVESGKGAPSSVPIDIGIKVQSLPGPGEKPHTFETVEKTVARPEWNRLRARQVDPARMPGFGDLVVHLAGVSTGLKHGDPLLVVWTDGGTHGDLRTVAAIAVDQDLQATAVTLDAMVGGAPLIDLPKPPPAPGAYALRQSAHLFAFNTPRWLSMSQKFRDDYVAALGASFTDTSPQEWPYFSISGVRVKPSSLFLDAAYPKVLAGSLVVLRDPDPHARVFNVVAVDRVAAAAFTVAGDVSQLTLDSDPKDNFDKHLRDTEVLLQSDVLPVSWPDESPVTGRTVAFDGIVAGLQTGQELAFTGPVEKAEIGPDFNKSVSWHIPPPDAELVSEVAVVDQVDDRDPLRTKVRLRTGLQNRFVRRRLTICANLAFATHGESKVDVLGSGDSSQTFQRFDLKQSPLTFVPSGSGAGVTSTLDIHVIGVRWHEVPTFYGRGPREHVFLTHISDEGKVSVEFGDGVTGARLPSGFENVTAIYRVGIGLGGRVRAGQLSLLQTRPLGVKNVSNPVPATGGADPELLVQARRNAPLTVVTFGRVVSLTDFETYAAAFAGIAKARAAWLWDGSRRIVHVTVGADGGAAVNAGTALKNLSSSIASASDGRQPFLVQSFEELPFNVNARLYRDPDYEWTAVKAAAVAALGSDFAFDAREFAAPLTESEVMATLQSVPGVLGVKLVGLSFEGSAVQPNSILVALAARLEVKVVKAAQLVVINPSGIEVEEQK